MMLIEKRTNAAGQVSLGRNNANKKVAVIVLKGRRATSTKRHSWRGLLDTVAAVLKTAGRPMSGSEIVRAIIRKRMWPAIGHATTTTGKFRTDMERAIWCQVMRDIQRHGEASRVKKLPPCQYALNRKRPNSR